MICSLSIVDTGLKGVSKIKDEIKITERMEVLELSLCQQYNTLNAEMEKILSHIHSVDEFQNINKMLNGYKKKLDYHPDEITLMNKVVDRLYKHGKYYLD